MGFTSHGQKNKERGRFLEEGFVEYFAEKFILYSEEKIVDYARIDLARSTNKKFAEDDKATIRDICQSEIRNVKLDRYKKSRLLIETLIEGARKLSDEEAVEMKKDLIKTRVDTKNTRKMMDRIDRIFGNGTTSRIYKMKFEDDNDENLKFINELRTKMGLSEG